MTALHTAKPFIIAEVGSNWKTFEEAKDSIQAAKMCGADAVKFQLFSDVCLYGPGPERNGILNLTPGDIPKLVDKAKAAGIEFMCTAFSPDLVDIVDPFVRVHKIASSDLNYVELLEHVKAKGKPILLSTGASSKGDIAQALQVLQGADVTLLYCNSAYPSRRHNLFNVQKLARDFGKPVGFSDHSTDAIYAPLSAARHFNVTVIEKHFNNTAHQDTPDAGHSLNRDEFKLMCDYIRDRRDTDGHQPTSEERDMMLRHNRRLIATKDINIGVQLSYGRNFGAYRSLKDDSHGFSPFILRDRKASPEGKAAKRALKAGDSIGPGDY